MCNPSSNCVELKSHSSKPRSSCWVQMGVAKELKRLNVTKHSGIHACHTNKKRMRKKKKTIDTQIKMRKRLETFLKEAEFLEAPALAIYVQSQVLALEETH